MKKTLTIEQIEEARAKVYVNTSELLEESALLFAHQRYARAYALAHLGCEEMAKLMMLARIGIDLLTGKEVDWRKLFRRFRSHDEKLRNMVSFDYMYLSKLDLEHDSDLKKYENDHEGVPKLSLTKNRSLYVDIEEKPATLPSEYITRDDVEALLALAHERFAICRGIEESSRGRLSEIVKTPLFAVWSKGMEAAPWVSNQVQAQMKEQKD